VLHVTGLKIPRKPCTPFVNISLTTHVMEYKVRLYGMEIPMPIQVEMRHMNIILL